jgi:hypothetical protein
MAERRGLRLEKSRRRDPQAVDYGTYQLVDAATTEIVGVSPLSLDGVERRLTGAYEFGRIGLGLCIDAEAGSVVTVKPGAVLDIAMTGQKLIAQEDGSLRELTAEELADERGPGSAEGRSLT